MEGEEYFFLSLRTSNGIIKLLFKDQTQLNIWISAISSLLKMAQPQPFLSYEVTSIVPSMIQFQGKQNTNQLAYSLMAVILSFLYVPFKQLIHIRETMEGEGYFFSVLLEDQKQ